MDNDQEETKLTESKETESNNHYLQSPDVDRGWAFAVLVAAFFTFLLIHGIAYSSSLFYIVFLDEFENSPSTTAWVVTINNSCTMLFGPLTSYLNRYISRRCLVAIGGIISTCGLLASSFVTNLESMFFTFGVITGMGWCLPLVFVFVFLTDYFHHWRTLMVTIATTGLAIGQFIYPPILQALFEKYHWRGAFIILAGINLNFLVIAAVMMPVRKAPVEEDNVKELETLIESEEIAIVLEINDSQKKKSKLLQNFQREVAPLKNYLFILFMVNVLLNGIGLQGFQTHIGNYARLTGSTTTHTSLLVSVIGVGSLTGRLTIGALIHVGKVNVILIYGISFFICGVTCICCIFYQAFYYLAALNFMFGYGSGSWGLYSEVLIATVGIEFLSQALGISFFACAIGALLGGPVAGWIFELDPSYLVTFVSVGVMLIISSLILIPSYIKSKKQLPQEYEADVA